jgi:hypothetical protein
MVKIGIARLFEGFGMRASLAKDSLWPMRLWAFAFSWHQMLCHLIEAEEWFRLTADAADTYG